MIADRYRIGELLGAGKGGHVYRADDLFLDEKVALKVLPAGKTGRVQQLFAEVRLARKVSHPNVCRVHDVHHEDGLFFICMEYIDGEDLASLLRRTGRLPGYRALEIGIQTAEGLAAIHAQGVLHLDLKPSNLMIDPSAGVKITDFGIAGRIGEMARGGTPLYMPPEQQDGSASEASDVYTLGLVLYELVTGWRPFAGPIIQVTLQHREVVPAPPSTLVDDIDPRIDRLILRCLEKDPARRPSSAGAVAEALVAARIAAHQSPLVEESAAPIQSPLPAAPQRRPITSGRLRRWPPARLPGHPYPLLLPYTHPQLLAGRQRELGELQRLLLLPVPILGLHAASGTGKSSLLMGGLVPWLKDAGWPVAYSRSPWEPGLADRLLGDLVEIGDDDGGGDQGVGWASFGDALAEVTRLSEDAPVLILDQFEELFTRADARAARAVAGALLASTSQRRPGLTGPPCRWLLTYRQEYHGDLVAWLSDVLADARAEGLAPPGDLPHNLDSADRFQAMSLGPLGAPASGADSLEEAVGVFRAAIEAPLRLRTAEGDPRYPIRFAPGHAERLAEAFGRTRMDHPDAPLAPELQVVLAYLLARADPASGSDGIVEVLVPDNVDSLIGEALEDHLQRALEAAFPLGLDDAAQGRARALLALRELAHASGRRNEGLSGAVLTRAIGEGGVQVLERLAAPDTRLVVAREHADGLRWVLSHDLMARAVVRLVESEGRHGGLLVDTELLALHRFISLESALFEVRGEKPDRVEGRRLRQIRDNTGALLCDEPRQRWWAACQARERTRWQRVTLLAAAIAVVLGLVATITWHRAAGQARLRGLYEQVAGGKPEAALAALDELRRRPDADVVTLRQQLEQRARPLDILERGLGGLPDETRSRTVLWAVEIALPLIEAAPDDPVLLASLVWALDSAPARDPSLADSATALRERALAPLRRSRPPPPLPAGPDPSWADIPSGTFRMGSAAGEGRDDEKMLSERPRHRVTLSAFRLLSHEVTNAEYRRLVPGHSGDDGLPVPLTWYEAYRYAAWLGGRLPTEAEWEYAARAGCTHTWCARDGSAATIDEVAWWIGSATDQAISEPRPVMQLEPNPWGLYDMLGNHWEWTADWFGPYPHEPQVNPVGATVSDYRVSRGGCYREGHAWVQAVSRGASSPTYQIGCRPLIPAASERR